MNKDDAITYKSYADKIAADYNEVTNSKLYENDGDKMAHHFRDTRKIDGEMLTVCNLTGETCSFGDCRKCVIPIGYFLKGRPARGL